MVRDYYLQQFREDLLGFMPKSDCSYFGHGWEGSCDAVCSVPEERRAAFLLCLYFTVLVDQAVHEHFPGHYPTFESLTAYPKFCHGLGQFQKNPRGILVAPIEQGFVAQADLDVLLDTSMELFVEEVHSFFQENLPAIQPRVFLEKLLYDPDVQIPLLIPLLSPELEGDIVVKAYAALRNAAKAKRVR